MNKEKEALATMLKTLRESRNISQPVLAERAGVAVETISRIENLKREPKMSTLVQIFEVLLYEDLPDMTESRPSGKRVYLCDRPKRRYNYKPDMPVL